MSTTGAYFSPPNTYYFSNVWRTVAFVLGNPARPRPPAQWSSPTPDKTCRPPKAPENRPRPPNRTERSVRPKSRSRRPSTRRTVREPLRESPTSETFRSDERDASDDAQNNTRGLPIAGTYLYINESAAVSVVQHRRLPLPCYRSRGRAPTSNETGTTAIPNDRSYCWNDN